jgi:hypothetical protein
MVRVVGKRDHAPRMANDDVSVLGAATLRERIRTLQNGTTKSKFTIEVSGDSIVTNFDERAWGAPLAAAIAELYRERISGITATVSAGVKRAREGARKAFDAGRPWAMRSYSGGKIGAKAPNQSDRKFNDSGRLASSIVATANETDKTFTINMAANRFKPELVRQGAAGVARIFEELKRLVPEFGDPKKLMDSIPIRKAMTETIAMNIVKAAESAKKTADLARQARQSAMAVGRNLLSALA